MNALVERFRRLDFDSNLTFAQERNGTIQFSGLQVARPPSADFLLSTTSISGATFVLAVGWALIFNHSVLPNLFAIIKTPFFVTILMCLSVMFAGVLWIAVRRVPRFVFDTERREITFKAKLRPQHIAIANIDYILVFRQWNPLLCETPVMGGNIALVDESGRATMLSAYGHLDAAKSDASVLAQLCDRPCLFLDEGFNARELWAIGEPREPYFGESKLEDKLRRSHGFTRERLAPFAQMLHQPKTTGAILAQAETREGAGVLSPGSAEVNRSIATESLQHEIGSYIGHEESTVVKLRR
jgi:hypothetical protein